MTVGELKNLRDILQARAIKPRRIESQQQADEMTALDPLGHVWEAGEEFFTYSDLRQTWPGG